MVQRSRFSTPYKCLEYFHCASVAVVCEHETDGRRIFGVGDTGASDTLSLSETRGRGPHLATHSRAGAGELERNGCI